MQQVCWSCQVYENSCLVWCYFVFWTNSFRRFEGFNAFICGSSNPRCQPFTRCMYICKAYIPEDSNIWHTAVETSNLATRTLSECASMLYFVRCSAHFKFYFHNFFCNVCHDATLTTLPAIEFPARCAHLGCHDDPAICGVLFVIRSTHPSSAGARRGSGKRC